MEKEDNISFDAIESVGMGVDKMEGTINMLIYSYFMRGVNHYCYTSKTNKCRNKLKTYPLKCIFVNFDKNTLVKEWTLEGY